MSKLVLAKQMQEQGSSLEDIMAATGLTIPQLFGTIYIRPKLLPDAYYISQFRKGKSVRDIANELQVHISLVYRAIEGRNLPTHEIQAARRKP
jgi:hypothetical protein